MSGINRHVREEAALICAIAARSNLSLGTWDVAALLGSGDAPRWLAYDAQRAVRLDTGLTVAEIYAEAEARLRCGWSR